MLNRSYLLGRWTRFLGIAILLSWAGCSGGKVEGPQRFPVSGSVTYAGQPLAFGSITFQPDESKGNSGPQGIAMIKDGVYDTRLGDGRGTTGGPMIVNITGTTHEVVTEGGEGRILFSGYSVNEDLPTEATTLNFDVPDASGKKNTAKRN